MRKKKRNVAIKTASLELEAQAWLLRLGRLVVHLRSILASTPHNFQRGSWPNGSNRGGSEYSMNPSSKLGMMWNSTSALQIMEQWRYHGIDSKPDQLIQTCNRDEKNSNKSVSSSLQASMTCMCSSVRSSSNKTFSTTRAYPYRKLPHPALKPRASSQSTGDAKSLISLYSCVCFESFEKVRVCAATHLRQRRKGCFVLFIAPSSQEQRNNIE